MPGLPPGYSDGGGGGGGGLTLAEAAADLPGNATFLAAMRAALPDNAFRSAIQLFNEPQAMTGNYTRRDNGLSGLPGEWDTNADLDDVGDEALLTWWPKQDDKTKFAEEWVAGKQIWLTSAGTPTGVLQLDANGLSKVGNYWTAAARLIKGELPAVDASQASGFRGSDIHRIEVAMAAFLASAINIAGGGGSQSDVWSRGSGAKNAAWRGIWADVAAIVSGDSADTAVTPKALDAAWGWMLAEAERAWAPWTDETYLGTAAIGGLDDVTVTNAGVPAGNIARFRTSAWTDAPVDPGGAVIRNALDVAIGQDRYVLVTWQSGDREFYKRDGSNWADMADDDPAVATHWLDAVRAKGAWRVRPYQVGYDNLPPGNIGYEAFLTRLADDGSVRVYTPAWNGNAQKPEVLTAIREPRARRPAVVPVANDITLTASHEQDIVLLGGSSALTATMPDITGDVGEGWWAWIVNGSTAAATVDGEGTDTIDGSASIQLASGKAILIAATTGASWAVLCRS